MQSQPGYVDTALHHAVMPDAGEQCLEPVDPPGRARAWRGVYLPGWSSR